MMMGSDFDSDHHRERQQRQGLHLLRQQKLPAQKFQNPSHSGISSQLDPLSQEISHAESSSAYSVWQKLKDLHPEVSRELTHRADIVNEKLPGELSSELGRELTSRMSSKKMVSGNPRRVCRICHRQFSSGRALGGHMRVHGPFCNQTAGSKKQVHSGEQLVASHSVDCKDQRRWGEAWDFQSSDMLLSKSVAAEDDDDEEESTMKSFAESEEEAEDARSERPSLSSEDDVHHDDEKLFCDDGNGVGEDFVADHGKEQSSIYSLDFTSKSELAGVGDGAKASLAMTTAKKSLLYQLRHNPKRSRRFTDQEFAMEMLAAGQAAIDFSTRRSTTSSPEKTRVCSECGKVFWSWKALFGHMRCHPEREWRGILPPESSSDHQAARFGRKRSSAVNSFEENSEFELESDVENKEDAEADALSKLEEAALKMKAAAKVEEEEPFLQSKTGDSELPECISGKEKGERQSGTVMTDDWTPRWPTGKRSRRRSAGKAGSLQTSPEEEPALTSETTSLDLGEEQEFETPNCLFLLAEAARKIEQDVKVQKSLLQLCPEESAFSLKDLKGGDEGEHEDEARLPSDARKSLVASSSSGIVKYECTTCKKSFNSHQALGGHRASHRKMKGCFAKTSLGEEIGEDSITGDEPELSAWEGSVQEKDPLHPIHKEKKKQKQEQLIKGHECSICHRVFSSGQALGGHKRCHWTGEKAGETASVASTNKQPSLLSGGGQSSKLDEGGIDLNLPAPMDDDDDDEVGYGSAELPSFHGKLVHAPEVEKKVGFRIDSPAARGNLDGLSAAAWTVKDLLGGQRSSSWEFEARCRFKGIWGQQWPNEGAAQLPQICAMQPI